MPIKRSWLTIAALGGSLHGIVNAEPSRRLRQHEKVAAGMPGGIHVSNTSNVVKIDSTLLQTNTRGKEQRQATYPKRSLQDEQQDSNLENLDELVQDQDGAETFEENTEEALKRYDMPIPERDVIGDSIFLPVSMSDNIFDQSDSPQQDEPDDQLGPARPEEQPERTPSHHQDGP